MNPIPEKMVIEPTTRCNFSCDYCVKQSEGCDIAEGDLNEALFLKCKDLFPHLKTVIFTGLGEPLMLDNLEWYAEQARESMPGGSTRGFQTNGKLLTPDRARSLFKAGMNKICVSVDSVQPTLFDTLRKGGTLSDVNGAFNSLKSVKKEFPHSTLEVGIEFVLMKDNMEELPGLVAWAGKRGVDFIIVSHLTAYETKMENQTVFLNNSFEALAPFEAFRQKALEKDIDITRYNDIRFKVYKSEKEIALYNLISDFKRETLQEGLYVNLFHLLTEPAGAYEKIRDIFDRSIEAAKKYGIELTLPSIRPKTQRECVFMETPTLFVTSDGNVSPCYFLWHQYSVMRSGYPKKVTPRFFGNLLASSPGDIWNQEDYQTFRAKVRQYDYPNCHAWCETRCDYVLEAPFYQDCYINDIPCCDCHWGLGLLNCLI